MSTISAKHKDHILAAYEAALAAVVRKRPGARVPGFVAFARNNLWVRTPTDEVVPFELFPIQRRYLAAKRLARMQGRPPRYLVLKYRRGGITTVEQGLSYYRVSRSRNVSVLTLAQDRETTSRLFRIPRLMHERDPQGPMMKGPGSRYRLEFPILNSIFYVGAAGQKGVARGDTLSRTHWSEVAFSGIGRNQVENQTEIMIGITEATEHGEVVLETTPNGSEMFRQTYRDAKARKNDWTPIFLAWFDDAKNRLPCEMNEAAEIVASLTDDETRLVQRRGLDPAQIKWRRAKVRLLGRKFAQEYPEDDESCWLSAGSPFFDHRSILDLLDDCLGPELVDDVTLGPMPKGAKVGAGGWSVEYEPPEPGVEYVIGADTSEGLPGCDRNGCGVMRRDNGRQVASCHGLFDIRTQASNIAAMHHRYNGALIGVERENHGHAVLQKLIDLGVGDPHYKGGPLYYNSTGEVSDRDARTYAGRQAGRAGWSTNSVTRPAMLEALRDWLDAANPLDRVRDRVFLTECLGFQLQASGRFDHDPGGHDDALMKWAIANQMRTVTRARPSLFVSTM